ncbi:hypothetical protein [Tenacibaculum aiptasiae]|uniref:hypothetical protein n=1 Tax=Tenacibaculum aiptasiae TaxID=426481 RepID=UPI003B5CB9B4
MIKNKQTRRIAIVVSLLVLFSWRVRAQGPVAPEAATFEPVDAMDMVNLVTGDLSYVLPILNVPSPEGGYPLTLSYHAGIAVDQEASWVGLGWNINPGAINRSVNGVPDDWKEEKLSSLVYDIGGTVTSHDFGIGVGWGKGKYSVGLYASYAENKAFGGETTYSFDLGVSGGYGNLQGRAGTDGVGLAFGKRYNSKNENTSVSAGGAIGIGYSFKKGAFSIAYSADYGVEKNSSTGTGTGANAKSKFKGSVGISSLSSLGGGSGDLNSSMSIAPAGDSFNLNISIFLLNINFSSSKIRYWHFDSKAYKSIGTLYAGNNKKVRDGEMFGNLVGFDTYSSTYDQTDESVLNKEIYLPSYDFYSVSGQGVSGNISPNLFEYGSLTPKKRDFNLKGVRYMTESYIRDSFTKEISNNSDNIYFYFNNENSSYLNINANQWGTTPASVYEFSDIASPTSTLSSKVTIDGVEYDNLNKVSKRLKKGDFIETYTNKQLIDNPSLVYSPTNFNRNHVEVPKDGIGAFKITTADGKTYHYSVPVYQRERFSRFAKYDENINEKFYEEFQLAPYATHWLLTAITGSDYVDDGDGKLSENDLGYWVMFDYGKWSDGYTWRTPRGSDLRTTPTSKTYEWGVREVYYLNAVKTRTHTALFVKGKRRDNKSIAKLNSKNYQANNYVIKKFEYNPEDDGYYFKGLGETLPKGYGTFSAGKYRTVHKVNVEYNRYNHDLLRLSKIVVLKNKLIPSDFNYSNPSESTSQIKAKIKLVEQITLSEDNWGAVSSWDNYKAPVTIHDKSWKGEYHENVLEEEDLLHHIPNIDNLSSNTIELIQDYSLATRTPNANNTLSGRLTLKKVQLKGRNGIRLVPPYQFEYGANYSYSYKDIDDWGYQKYSAAAWSMNKIIDPIGSEVIIDYESDDYSEAVNYETFFKEGLKFVFYNYNGKLRFDVTNLYSNNPNNVNFLNFFKENLKAKVNIWACTRHEYRDWDCQVRWGKVNIEDKLVDVVSVVNNKVVFETDLNLSKDHRSGRDSYLFGREFSYDMKDLQLRKRGLCPDMGGGCPDATKHVFYYNIASNITEENKNGGGVRVKQIKVKGDNKTYTTNYYYNQEGFDKNKNDINYKSSGVTSYAPSKYNKNIKYMSELPAPSVLYGNVVVESDEFINNYKFKTLAKEVESGTSYSLGDVLQISKVQDEKNLPIDVTYYNRDHLKTSINKLNKGKYEIKNNFSMLGKLLEHNVYNKEEQLLSKHENKYLPLSEIKQGVKSESFNTYSVVGDYWDVNKIYKTYQLSITSKSVFPSVLKETVITEGGQLRRDVFSKYDFNTGELLETKSYMSQGELYKTKKVPAHTIGAYSKMGSKVDNETNKNMLVQEAANYSYIFRDNTWKALGVGITTWKNSWDYILNNRTTSSTNDIWRKHRSYVWKGLKNEDGTLGFTETQGEVDFNWTIGIDQSDNWQLLNETTRYDHYSQPIEVKDINGNYVTTKMGDSYSKVIATANANYDDVYYSGAEYVDGAYFDGGIKATGYKTVLESEAHTGRGIVEVGANIPAFETLVPERKERNKAIYQRFKLSVWVKKLSNGTIPTLKINIGSSTGDLDFEDGEDVRAGDWVKKQGYITIPSEGTTVSVKSPSVQVQLDDFRLHPMSSGMMSYVYNEWDQVTHIIGTNGLYTHYKYDAVGKLSEVWTEVTNDTGITEGKVKIKEYRYTYKKFVEMDTNGNGELELSEVYSTINLSLGASLLNSGTGSYVVRAYVSGGSGDFEYRWVLPNSSSTNVTYSSWSDTLSEIPMYLDCDERKYYRCQVKDKVTGAIREAIGTHIRTCGDGDGDIKEIEEQ